jgi:hypothetical protein
MMCRNGGGIYYDNCDTLQGMSGCFFGFDSEFSRVIYADNKALGKKLNNILLIQLLMQRAIKLILLLCPGAGGAVYSNCNQLQSDCRTALSNALFMDSSNVIPRVQFTSNIAQYYGNDIATAPAKFVALGDTSNAQVNVCREQGLIRNQAQGILTLAVDKASSLIYNRNCTVILAPYGVDWVSLTVNLSTLKYSSNHDPNAYQNSSCDFDSLNVYECRDFKCESGTLLSRICGNEISAVAGPPHRSQNTPGGIQIFVNTGIMRVTYTPLNQSNIIQLNATFNSYPLYQRPSGYIPGQEFLDITLVRVDDLQSIVPPTAAEGAVSSVLCSPSNNNCNMFTSITPVAFYGFGVDNICYIQGRQLFACGIHENTTVLEISLVASIFPPLVIRIECLPCSKGQSRKDITSDKRWTCVSCLTDQYIIDSNNPRFECQLCPVGARCDGNTLVGIVHGSVWVADMNTGQYRLSSCPKV